MTCQSSPALSDMERQDYIDQINDLKASNRRLMDMIDTLKKTLDSESEDTSSTNGHHSSKSAI